MRMLSFTLAGLLLGLLLAPPVRAENEGQSDLDQAIETKLGAETLTELGKVIELCESALEKGLDTGNTEFCKKLLASTLLQRAEAVSSTLFDGTPLGMPPRQRLRVALNELERSLEYDPDQVEAQLLMGKLQVLGGDAKRARKAFDDAIRLLTDNDALRAEALRLRAGVQEKIADRLTDLNESIRLAADDPKSFTDRGQVYLSLGKADEAVADFEAALKLDADNADTLEARGMALESLKRWDEARADFTRAAELSPGSPGPLLQRARLNVLAGDHEAAADDAAAALRLDPDNLFGLLVRAQSLALADKPEEALPEAERALQLHPDSDNAVQVWAMIVEKIGRTPQTIKQLVAEAENDPDEAVVWTQLALLYSAQRKLGKAIEAFTAAIKADNTRPFLYRMRADVYLSVGEQQAALADYEAAMQLEPDDTGVLNNLAWLLATSPEEELRDGRRAIKLATKAGELTHHQQAHILSTIAAAYAETGDFATARRWSEKAVELGDDSLKEQLRKELASYEDEKPWREKQQEPAEPKADDKAK